MPGYQGLANDLWQLLRRSRLKIRVSVRMNAVDRTIIESLREARRVVVLTGAGVSAESGVPTFRDKQAGLWESPDATCRDAVLQQEAGDCGWRNWSRLLPS